MKNYIKRLYIFGAIVFVIIVASMMLQYQYNNQLLEDNIKDMTEKSAEVLNIKINRWLNDKAQVINSTANLFAVDGFDDGKKLAALEQLLEENDDFSSIYYGKPDNQFITASDWEPPASFDLRVRPWYLKAVEEEGLIFSEAFTNASNDNIIVTIARPVYSNDKSDGQLEGVVAGDLNISTIVSYVKEARGQNEQLFILTDSNGNILAHPEIDDGVEKDLHNIEDICENSLSDLAGQGEIIKTEIDEQKGYFLYEDVAETDWYLTSFIPFTEYNNLFENMLQSFLLGILVMLIVFISFFYFQYQNAVKPLEEFNQEIQRIDLENNLDYRLKEDKNSDFSFLSESINSVLEKTQEYFNNLVEKKESLSFFASHDALTMVANRRYFIEELDNEIDENSYGSVLLLDIDEFKEINDTLGHVTGDIVLQVVASRLEELNNENVTLARYGGDEFLILLKKIDDPLEVEEFILKIREQFIKPVDAIGNEVYVDFSVGVTQYPEDSNNPHQLITNADIAMHRTKKSRKGQFIFFNQDMIDKLHERKDIRNILNEAVDNDGFRLVFQPQVNLKTSKADKVEALVRLKNHDISPGKFIPVAENTNLIIKIGRLVTEKAIMAIAGWKEQDLKPKMVSLNYSAKQLNDESYVHFLKDMLEEYDVRPDYLEIEITESCLFSNIKEAMYFLRQLQELGVKIALDDFGTGYSSFNQLSFVPADHIKLDRSLIQRFTNGDENKAIGSLIDLIHNLGFSIVAEGIEEEEGFRQLEEINCDYIQGYYFSRPLSERDLIEEYEKEYF